MTNEQATERGGRRHRVATILAHVIFIVVICVLPEMLSAYAGVGAHRHSLPWWYYAKSGLTIVVFYINYLYLIDRTVFNGGRWWRLVMWNVLLVAAVCAVMWWLGYIGMSHHVGRPRGGMEPSAARRLAASASFIMRDAVMLVLSVGLALALRLASRWLDMEHRRRELAAAARATELSSLRSQLNPHFLFNTLNSIYALIELSPDTARRAVHELSQLLRYVVYENPALVDLQREVDFIHNYVELMKLRLGKRPVTVVVERHVTSPVDIPPLLFVTLVENAFKHGVTSNIGDAIAISLHVDDHQLTFTTDNAVEDADSASPGGVGIANLSRRLELIYGYRARLTTSVTRGRYHATLTINRPCQSPEF